MNKVLIQLHTSSLDQNSMLNSTVTFVSFKWDFFVIRTNKQYTSSIKLYNCNCDNRKCNCKQQQQTPNFYESIANLIDVVKSA